MKPASGLLKELAAPIRRRIAGEVVAVFNDAGCGDRPVRRSPDALFAPTSEIWKVHGDVGSMMIGGVSGLLLQMLHPAVLAGVWDHSNFRSDMHGRLRRTARFIALTTYGALSEAEAAIERVRAIHSNVSGLLPDGRPYVASDPALLAWVHVTEAVSFLSAWIRYCEPSMPLSRQDRYFEEFAQIARYLGADPVPTSRSQADMLLREMRDQLEVDVRTKEVASLVLSRSAVHGIAAPIYDVIMRAGVDLLPEWARRMHGLSIGPGKLAVRAGAFGLAQTVRWAFRA